MSQASSADTANRMWCDRVVAELRRHHEAGALGDDPSARAWLDEISQALAVGLGEWGFDLDDPRQRGAAATVALVLHQCATVEGSESTEEVAARLACLLAALCHTVVHRLGVGVEGGLSAAAPSDVPCGEGGAPGGTGAATGPGKGG